MLFVIMNEVPFIGSNLLLNYKTIFRNRNNSHSLVSFKR